MPHYILYSSSDCCLCDDAMHILNEFRKTHDFSITKKDIYADKALLVKYKVRIPVLKDIDSGRELGWPFTLSSLQEWASVSS